MEIYHELLLFDDMEIFKHISRREEWSACSSYVRKKMVSKWLIWITNIIRWMFKENQVIIGWAIPKLNQPLNLSQFNGQSTQTSSIFDAAAGVKQRTKKGRPKWQLNINISIDLEKKCNQKYHLLFNRSDKPDKSNRKYNQL